MPTVAMDPVSVTGSCTAVCCPVDPGGGDLTSCADFSGTPLYLTVLNVSGCACLVSPGYSAVFSGDGTWNDRSAFITVPSGICLIPVNRSLTFAGTLDICCEDDSGAPNPPCPGGSFQMRLKMVIACTGPFAPLFSAFTVTMMTTSTASPLTATFDVVIPFAQYSIIDPTLWTGVGMGCEDAAITLRFVISE